VKALRLENIGVLELKESPVPQAGVDKTVLKVTHCAVCRTDAKMWRIGHRDLVLPRVLGHEICGVSEKLGQRVVVWPGQSCGQCDMCLKGSENLCRGMRIIGFHEDGGFAEYVRVPESSLVAVPDDLPGDVAALAEPVACAVNAVRQAEVAAGEDVLIYGAGPVGLLTAVAVRARGARPFLKEINPLRLVQTETFRLKIGARTSEKRAYDVVVNAAPSTDTFTDGLSHLADGGRFCLFSGLTDNRNVPASVINEIHYRQLRISGAYGCTRAQMESALKIISDFRHEVEWLIEARVTLAAVPSVLPKIADGLALKTIVEF
jgi:L-iditol 2-dehydrogenase